MDDNDEESFEEYESAVIGKEVATLINLFSLEISRPSYR